jgi:hypothetical protein
MYYYRLQINWVSKKTFGKIYPRKSGIIFHGFRKNVLSPYSEVMLLFYPEYRGSTLLSDTDKLLKGYTASYPSDIYLKGRQIWETDVNVKWDPLELRL